MVNTTVAVEEAWGQAAVAVLEEETFFEFGYELSEDSNNSVVQKKPTVVVCDPEGKPLYYLFSVLRDDEIINTVKVSANKTIGRTVINIGNSFFSCDNEIHNLSKESAGSETECFVCGTPVPEYGDRYRSMMVDAWETGNLHSKNFLNDLKDAGVDISKPIPGQDRAIVQKIFIANLEKRNQVEEEFENKYGIDWIS